MNYTFVAPFANSDRISLHNSTVNTVGGDQINYTEESGLRLLYQEIAQVGAFHDSEDRFPPPQCHPETRKAVLADISAWITEQETRTRSQNSVRSTKPVSHYSQVPIYWLHGPAGVGKSAIAQTLAERFKDSHLAASFFFSRLSPRRNNPRFLFATIAYRLAMSGDTELRAAIDTAVRTHHGLLGATIETQFLELVVKPLRSLPREKWENTIPKIVIIDGLDECQGSDSQRRVLTTILNQLVDQNGKPRYCIPLRFLIASRPEPQIREILDRKEHLGITTRIELGDNYSTSRDIERYLRDGFDKILRTSDAMRDEPSPWPSQGVIDSLVQRASGQFIYASTVLKYVEDEDSLPKERLELVLGLPVGDPDAFSDLDALYRQIMHSNSNISRVLQILGALHCIRSDLIELIEKVLALSRHSVSVALRRMHSVLEITHDSILLYHKSFTDFLLDRRRSGEFFLDKSLHHASITQGCMRIINTPKNSNLLELQYALENFLEHLKHSKATPAMIDDLKEFRFCHYLPWNLINLKHALFNGARLDYHMYIHETFINCFAYFTILGEKFPDQLQNQISTWSKLLTHGFYVSGIDKKYLHFIPELEVLFAFITESQHHFPWSSILPDILAYLGYNFHLQDLSDMFPFGPIICHLDFHSHTSNDWYYIDWLDRFPKGPICTWNDWHFIDLRRGHHSLTESYLKTIRLDSHHISYLSNHFWSWTSHLQRSTHELSLVKELAKTVELLDDEAELQEVIYYLQNFPDKCPEVENTICQYRERIAALENYGLQK
ncbi:hypothetical protein K435DRAFT_846471 [Dendrothele bispora CBS 962.96]|uniref:NACHT domain-containing protein n=1 Tax=Dendrothele bispora (strain CBS 962.96) TaxID=1314807 RepID=A0A4S8KMK0_DENBC|nr:hypothetical protein K435DRAFT_846471 [Dendrothele bispora CBS 962.96]